ncbi:LysR family transcriptional regulator [Paenibacillus sp. S150]|uniref:LysR family transcriptional regulator n=1 Tax=Paenibacillus sp. S150 TaxID=2749826 RepID=UPI001C58DBB6|nr:LysR family transcriptional regulator [Paenibacillus sp. S150]MBW4082004.1 LysR family transcriptional regulator [Paenibacillus sp. S150]
MTLIQLEVFVAIIETQSFTKAGEKLGLTQSAVSHALKNLEQAWGVKLLERNRSGFVLMPVGQRLLRYARDILRLNQSIQEELAKEKGLLVGTVRIGSFPTASAAWLPDVFAAFHDIYPSIETLLLEGGYQDIHDWLLNGHVDIALLPLPQADFDTLTLLEENYVAAVPEGHPLADQTCCCPEDFRDAGFIMPLAGSESMVNEWLSSRQVTPTVVFALDYTTTLLSMVKRGLGVSLVPVSSQIPAGVATVALEPELKRTIGLAVRSFQTLSPAVKAMISVFQTVFAVQLQEPPSP